MLSLFAETFIWLGTSEAHNQLIGFPRQENQSPSEVPDLWAPRPKYLT